MSFESWSQEPLKEFITDECTMYPEGTKDQPKLWSHCCVLHDLFYWAGGSNFEMDRADLILEACVEETGQTVQAKIMYHGIRLGHLSPISFKDKSFGNGWTMPRERQPLSPDEKLQLREKVLTFDLSDSIVQEFLDTI